MTWSDAASGSRALRTDRVADRRWCILRTGGPRTVRLATVLQDAGFDAWTPIERRTRRKPRSKVVEHIAAPLTPTYVFLREDQLADVVRVSGQGLSLPPFSVFRYYGATVFLPQRSLHPLRALHQSSYLATLPERAKIPQRKARGEPYALGETVTLTQGALAGFDCQVEGSDGLTTTLTLTLFGRTAGVKMKTSQLRAAGVATTRPAA